MKIRFFSAFETAMATFYSDLAPFIAEAGHQVEVVISKAEYRAGRNLEGTIGHIEGVEIYRTTSFGLQPKGKLKMLVVMVAYFIQIALYTLFGPKAERNVFLTTPPLLPLWGYVLSKLRRQPYYVVVMDVYPDLVVEYGRMQRDAFITKVMDWLSTFALRKADGIIAIGRCMIDRLQEKGVSTNRIFLIPNWMNEQLVRPIDPEENKFLQQHKLGDKFVILYSGNMGTYHHFEDILTVAEQFQARSDIAFVFIGGGPRYRDIEVWLEAHPAANVLLLPFQDIKMLPHSLSAGDIHLVTLTEACTGLAVPSKSYGILAAGRPILYQGSATGEIARVIQEEEVGAVVPCGDAEALKHIILNYVDQPGLSQEQGRRARQLMEGPYSRLSALERYTKVLTRSAIENQNLLYSPQS